MQQVQVGNVLFRDPILHRSKARNTLSVVGPPRVPALPGQARSSLRVQRSYAVGGGVAVETRILGSTQKEVLEGKLPTQKGCGGGHPMALPVSLLMCWPQESQSRAGSTAVRCQQLLAWALEC